MDRLDPHQLAAVQRACEHSAALVPVVVGDTVCAWNATSDLYPAPGPGITVRDFVLNMEVLGAVFALVAFTDVTCLLSSSVVFSENLLWRERERALCDAFQPAADGRTAEVVAFLTARGDEALHTGRAYKKGETKGAGI